jgi:Ca-activated chloride channel family protein
MRELPDLGLGGLRLLEAFWLPLVLLPLLVVLVSLRLRRDRAVRFTGTRFLEELLPGARGAFPLVCVTIAASMLLLTLTEPRLSSRDTTARANVILVIDVSGSMSAADVPPSRLSVAVDAASAFVTALPTGWKSGVVAFSERAFVLAAPTEDRASVLTALGGLTAQGGTATGDAIDLAIDAGRAGGAERLEESITVKDALENPSATVLVLLSDGAQTAGEIEALTAAERARSLGVPVHAIAFGTDDGSIDIMYPDGQVRPLDVPPDFATSARIAQTTNGEFFTAVTARELDLVYQSVTEVLEEEENLDDLTPHLVALAGVLLVFAVLPDLRRRLRRSEGRDPR